MKKDFIQYFIDGERTLEDAQEKIKVSKDEGLCFYLLQKSVENLLKALLSYYEVPFPKEEYIDLLIEHLENKTTIKFPEFKETLLELAFVPYEGGCASSTIYEKRPEYFIESVISLKEFVQSDIPVF